MTEEQAQEGMEDVGLPVESDAPDLTLVQGDTVADNTPANPPEQAADAVADTLQVESDTETPHAEAPSAEDRAILLASVPVVELPPSEPEPVAEPEPAAAAEPEPAAEPTAAAKPEPTAADPIAFPDGPTDVSIWPFVAYGIVWLAFAGFVVWQLVQLPAGVAVYDSAIYPVTLLGGLVLTAAGPLLIVVTWFAEKGRLAVSSGQAFLSALVRGSIATAIGVALWWAALLVVDQIRLGRLF